MSNKSTVEGLSALLHTLMFIPYQRWTDVKVLQQALAQGGIERSTRSIKRYLDEVIVEVFNVECDNSSQPHQYRRTSHQLLKYDPKETATHQILNRYLTSVLPDELLGLPTSIFGNPRLKVSAWLNKLHIDVVDIRDWSEEQRHVLKQVHSALFYERMLTLSSQVLQQERLQVEPLGLSVLRDTLLLLFRTSNHSPIRSLALPLIDDANVSTLSFTYPSDFKAEEYVATHTDQHITQTLDSL
ncbi:transcriptional regulator [Vibrio sp. ZSDZ65]|uniref:Transcriptional regulator n=1 Tax=Vibrio qingdaonensis TaxID=2829491 RepID=A0A9X3CT91_9VIBR|nr:transcriptional regulator [Vibrio qingdaonensis]MCW8349322.1 transcriptional regulator [Vibrio qingdaonensis]